jgi:hypothetical protein
MLLINPCSYFVFKFEGKLAKMMLNFSSCHNGSKSVACYQLPASGIAAEAWVAKVG